MKQLLLVKPNPKLAKKLVEQAAREEAAGDYIRALGDTRRRHGMLRST